MKTVLTILAQLHRDEVNLPGHALNQGTADRVLGVARIIFGGIALIMMAYAGFKYITSQGNPQETAKAQQTIIYTLVGLVVAIFAVTLISFVIKKI